MVNAHTYVVTPFRVDDKYAVDYSAFASSIQFLVEQGVQVVAGWDQHRDGTGGTRPLLGHQLAVLLDARQYIGDCEVVFVAHPAYTYRPTLCAATADRPSV